MKDSTAYMITDMLRTFVSSGLGITANIGSLDIAGKNRYNKLFFRTNSTI